MSNEADKPTSPAQDPELLRLRQELDRANQNYANLRSSYNQRDQEAAEARRILAENQRRSTMNDYQEEEVVQPKQNGNGGITLTQDEYDEIRFRTAKTEFLLQNEDGRKYWDRINAIILDPTKAGEYAAWDGRGRVNFDRAIKDIHRDLRWQEVEEARRQAAAQPPPAPAPAQPSGTLISGAHTSSSGPTGALPDLDKMTPKERQKAMIDAGYVEIDPEDPPRL